MIGTGSTQRSFGARSVRRRPGDAATTLSGTISCTVLSPGSVAGFVIAVACCIACACRRETPSPEVQILGESTRWRAGDPIPTASPWFDGERLAVIAARGETIGLQVF